MSKDVARGPQSYVNERLVLALVPELLRAKGFEAAKVLKRHGMKFIQARDAAGGLVVFWLKQGWSDTRTYSAIQFGMFSEVNDPSSVPNDVFIDYVAARTSSAKAKGATHALLVHMVDSTIKNYVALPIADVGTAYRDQIQRWPARARNTKTPTLYFEDSRKLVDAVCITAVTNLEVQLEDLAGLWPQAEGVDGPHSKKVTAEIERRLKQQSFRVLVGDRCGWACVVSGTSIPEVLDAAHLPGRNWREHNAAGDGILLRADLHRLMDQGLAEIRDGRFQIAQAARVGEYKAFHDKAVAACPPITNTAHLPVPVP